MVTARCARVPAGAVPPRAKSGRNKTDGADFDDGTIVTTTTTTCCCMTCCYSLAPDAAGTTRGCDKTEPAATTEPCGAECDPCDPCDPPSEAAAFVASATAAAFVLLAALLAVVLSSAAILTFFSIVPAAAAAVDVRGHQQQQSQQQHHHQWHFLQQQEDRRQPQRPRYDDAPRRKRQLFKDREPGIISLTFSLIGGTVTDVKQAYRNVSGIVQETLAESVRQPTTTSEAAPAADGDQTMMAAGNTAENEIGGPAAASTTTTTTAAPPVDQKLINRELRKLVGRNYRGLRRLFDSELRSAIKNSPSNVRDFTLELVGAIGQSLRPSRLFTRGPVDGDNTTAASE